ncbi:MAG TPA: DUF3365 domain-containing protein [Nitrococcus sp.]|nr:DUF3365 domain-containing protein [Nitrococcus sp.]
MNLRLKFNLALSLAMLVGIGLAALFSYRFLEQNAKDEVLDGARIMLQSALSVRQYTVAEVRPLLALQQKRQFLPQTVPAYSARKYIEHLQKTYPDYSYREATLNPTNPVDRATAWEADIVNWYRNNHDAKELIGVRSTATGPAMYLSRPIKVTNQACLTCHGAPSAAPPTMISSYGSANGFGWKPNEVVGAQIVTVPMSVPLARAHNTFLVFVGALVAVFLLVAILLNVMLEFVIIRPVKAMSRKASEISMGALNVAELEVSGKDEIAQLGRSFNRMHRSLANAVKLLDEGAV